MSEHDALMAIIDRSVARPKDPDEAIVWEDEITRQYNIGWTLRRVHETMCQGTKSMSELRAKGRTPETLAQAKREIFMAALHLTRDLDESRVHLGVDFEHTDSLKPLVTAPELIEDNRVFDNHICLAEFNEYIDYFIDSGREEIVTHHEGVLRYSDLTGIFAESDQEMKRFIESQYADAQEIRQVRAMFRCMGHARLRWRITNTEGFVFIEPEERQS